MASSTTAKRQYLLPGERDNFSSIVHLHGTSAFSRPSSLSTFISIPRIYEPKENDFIIGIVIVRTPDLFLVDINSPESAVLPTTSFDYGRLPTRNAMNRLSVVYTRVARAESWIQTELSCQSTDRSKKKSELGLLEHGNILRCSLALCEKLQRSQLINRFSQMLSNFRIRVARNGFIWYTTDTINVMIAVKNVLAEHELEDDIEYLINRYYTLMDTLQKQDDSLVKAKQQQQQQQEQQQQQREPTEKKEIEIKKIPQVMNINSNNNAVSRLLNQVIKSVLDSIIDDIEKNEKK